MSLSRAKMLLIGTVFLLFAVPYVKADGAVIPSVVPEKEINLPSQKAVILWDGNNETLILQTIIKGKNMNSLAWIIPVQSKTKPEVNEANVSIFKILPYIFGKIEYPGKGSEILYFIYSLPILGFFIILMIVSIIKSKDKSILKVLCTLSVSIFFLLGFLLCLLTPLTGGIFSLLLGLSFFILGIIGIISIRREEGLFAYSLISELILLFVALIVLSIFFYPPLIVGHLGPGKTNITPIEIIETKKVGLYDVVILKATNATYMVNWLNQNGFHISYDAIPILQEYCDLPNFYFVVNKISLSDLPEVMRERVQEEFEEGTATPLEIKFSPEKPYYPLKISSINGGNTEIDIFFFSLEDFYKDESGIFSVKKKADFALAYSTIVRFWSSLEGLTPPDKLALEDLVRKFSYRIDEIRAIWLKYEGPLQNLNEDAYFVKFE